ncbi:hypothetical protein ACT6QG_02155 [Xanthobacter sp. TB0136]|uniref:hypothetical protein n=1 Tax=Xanthobacter sp. TB0136 TaxID=3459177 RepID=UPI004039C0BD
MLLDVKAALAEILNDEAANANPANVANRRGETRANSQNLRISTQQPPKPEMPQAAKPAPSGAVVIHLARGPGLPTHPATCAGCGKADWKVAMRTADGRTWHVSCWKAERIEGASK